MRSPETPPEVFAKLRGKKYDVLRIQMRRRSIIHLINQIGGWLSSLTVNGVSRNAVMKRERKNGWIEQPLVVVAGATGTGKTKLSVEICREYDGEVVNADALQIYQGLDIATNKASDEEKKGIVHHMISFLDPLAVNYHAGRYRDQVLPLLGDIWKRGKLPVLVGGTNYYLESLLWTILVDTSPSSSSSSSFTSDEHYPDMPAHLMSMSNEQLYGELKRVDPVSAGQVHMNDRFRVMRAVQIEHVTGRAKSWHLAAMRRHPGAAEFGDRLRFGNTLMLWLDADPALLDTTINDRVSEMICRGLEEEIVDFYAKYPYSDERKSKGIYQSIGLKELKDYVQLTEEEQRSERGRVLWETGCELIRARTRRYARSQRRYLANRLFFRVNRQRPLIYKIDTSDREQFSEKSVRPALDIVDCFLNGRQICWPIASADSHNPNAISDFQYAQKANQICHCDVCNRDIQGHKQYEDHISGTKHRYLLNKTRKMEQEGLIDSKNDGFEYNTRTVHV